MAYLPYRMYGNGSASFPVVDIVQTVNTTTQTGRTQNTNKTPKPASTSSSKGLSSTRKEFDFGCNKSERQSVRHRKKKSASYDFLPKETLSDDEMKNTKKATSKTKVFKYRKNAPQPPAKLCCFERGNDAVGEKKSLQVLFKAGKSSNCFDRDGMEEEEFNYSLMTNPIVFSADLKRKGSFADYIKMKRRK